MAWEQRGNRTYYYRSVRVGTRVTKEYAGGGLMGTLAECFDAEHREKRAMERQMLKVHRERWAALEYPMRELDDLADLLVTATLAEHGYHRHDRGNWRRRRARPESA